MYEGHALDEITLDGTFAEARKAAGLARVTGSVGATVDGVKVERIEGPAFRVPGPLSDIVIVLAGNPGQYASHGVENDYQAIIDEFELAEAPEPEAEEDYLRALLHNEDI